MFKFIKNDDDGEVVCQYNIEHCYWPDIVEKFQEFLSGCGYVFSDGFDMAAVLEEANWGGLREQEVNKKLPLDLGDYT
jgi:hypothetical protein